MKIKREKLKLLFPFYFQFFANLPVVNLQRTDHSAESSTVSAGFGLWGDSLEIHQTAVVEVRKSDV